MIFLFLAAAGWQAVSDKEGVTLEARELAGKPFKEYRASAHSPLPVEKYDAYFLGRFAQLTDSRIERKILEKGADRMVVADRIKMPVGSDRHYALEFKRTFEAATKVLEWRFFQIDAKDAPACEGCVKMPAIHGSWTFAAREGNGTDITYVVYSDPGGDIPKFMVTGKQADATVDRLRGVMKDAAK